MEEVSTIGLDIAKQVFQVHAASADGAVLFSRKITRARLLGFFASQSPCLVAMEACGGAHHWAREIAKLGHEVRLIPPAYVKPFAKRQKSDAVDAEAICEAVQRPNMRFVAVKTEAQQASGCCQSDGNLSPIGAASAWSAYDQAMSNCHSASAAERRIL